MTARRLAAVAVCCLLLALSGGTAGAAAPGGRISAVEVSADRVQFLFTAQGLPSGTPLDPRSVKVTAGGRSLPARAEPPGAPRPGGSPTGGGNARAVMLVLDTSGSMSAADLRAARTGALSFLGLLPADVPAGFTTTGTPKRPLVAPTTDRAALEKAIGRIRPGGETALYDAVSVALDRLAAAGAEEGRIVVLSDGRDSASRATLSQVLTRLRATRTPADVVAFRTAATSAGTLRRLAGDSGGRLLSSPDARRLNAAFADAAAAYRQSMWISVTLPETLEGTSFRLEVLVRAGSAAIRAAASTAAAGGPTAAPGGDVPGAVPREETASTGLLGPTAGVPLAAVLGVCFVAIMVLVLLAGGGRRSGPEWAARIERYRLRARPSPEQAASRARNPLLRWALDLSERSVGSGELEQRLARDLDRAGILLRPHEWTLLRAAVALGSAVVLSLVLGNPLLGLLVGSLLAWAATRIYLRGRGDRRLTAFADQLPDALQLVAGSLRSGFSVAQSIERLAGLQLQPLGSEMARAVAQTRLGVSTEDALRSVADRMNCRDLHWVVLAIQVQREVGGNLAEVIETTVETMRERTRLRRQIRALSAEGRFSAYILIALPIATSALLMVLRPSYMRPLYTTTPGLAMSLVATLLIVAGWLWMRQTVKVEA
ncbi:tight adherence protein B [Thermomonospora echinospora]|uniref:Tight adherence protein B n=1 Tax=Thermomonospora echinospora TaxID=1992 RepID=A0A1H5X1M2_9ACTN|nr:tight adherence protein B [Thermomonospora echinospora]